MPLFGKLTIVGVGLIGGSAGIAAVRRGLAGEVWGVARRAETIDAALDRGAINRGTLSLSEGVSGADFVLFASSVSSIPELIKLSLPFIKPGAVMTDAGSVKRAILDEVAGLIPENIGFAGSHPVAGSEKSGVEFADGGLFEGACCVVTPLPGRRRGLEEVKKFWRMIGMRVVSMSPRAHDRMIALTSHLPHIAACGLINAASSMEGWQAMSAGGFRDTTRIASADPALWRDILLLNRDNLVPALKEYSIILRGLESALTEGDPGSVLEFLVRARESRDTLLNIKSEGKTGSGKKRIVAIDGPAGSGKSTAARLAAEKLNFLYLDTGAMYRAATWKAMNDDIDFNDRDALAESAAGMKLCFEKGHVIVEGTDVTEQIRSAEVTKNVYRIADIQGVRDAMVLQQRKLGENGGIVAEGRDIGTIVFPGAETKIYLDASVSQRALRRHGELKAKGVDVLLEEVEKEITERDYRDKNRKIAPLRPAEGAVILDTTDMSIEEVVSAVVEIALKPLPGAA